MQRQEKPYRDGMILGRGGPLMVNTPNGRVQRRIAGMSGSGTFDDPSVIWIGSVPRDQDRKISCERIAREQAYLLGVRTAVPRGANHNTVLRRDTAGRTVINRRTGRCELDPADEHISLYLGDSWINLQLQGHAYVNVDGYKVPIGLMTPEQRVLIHDGKERVSFEYWGLFGSLGYNWPPLVDPNFEDNAYVAHRDRSWRTEPQVTTATADSNGWNENTSTNGMAAAWGALEVQAVTRPTKLPSNNIWDILDNADCS